MIPDIDGALETKLGRGALGFLAGTPSDTEARGRLAPGPPEERRGSTIAVGDVTDIRVVLATGGALLLADDKGRELVEDERGLEAGGAMEVLREAVVVLAVVLVLAGAAAGALAALVVDDIEDDFLTVGFGGGLLVEEERDVFDAVVGLV